jgi:peptide/nickel transport system permease protein
VVRFLLSRLFQAILTLFAISVLVFGMARLSGNPLDVIMPEWATPEMYAETAAKLGLDKSYPEQYFMFVKSVLQGDFGMSADTRQPIAPMFFSAMLNSIKLIAVSFPFAFFLAIPLAMIAAVRVGTLEAQVVMAISVFGQSAPAFFVGLVLMWIFSVKLKILPPARMAGPESYILPGISLMLYTLAAQTRILRNSLLRVMGSDFIKLVRLKGVSERVLLWKHALKNSSLAMLTNGIQILARLVVGAVVVETVFAWPGAGRLIYEGILTRDYALIQTSVLVISAMMVLSSILIDIVYAYIDPRIRVF